MDVSIGKVILGCKVDRFTKIPFIRVFIIVHGIEFPVCGSSDDGLYGAFIGCVSYCDDDIFFYDNWLVPQIGILRHFPNVAAVTGNPIRTSFRWGNENTLRWAEANGTLEVGRFIPREWEDDFCVSIGRNPSSHITYTEPDKDYRVTYRGMTAYCTAHHCQTVGYASTLGKAPRYDNDAMSEERTFDIALDRIGLRLCTIQRYARHIGNVMDDRIRAELEKLNIRSPQCQPEFQH